jgi:hypothetical protein
MMIFGIDKRSAPPVSFPVIDCPPSNSDETVVKESPA